MNYNPFVMAELLATRDRLEQYKKCFADPDCRIQNAIECFSYMIDSLTGGQLSETDALKEWVNYCFDSFSKDMPKKAYNQVQNTSQVDVSVNNSERIKIDLLPNIPYTKGFLNFKYKKDLDFETEKSLAILLNYKGADYIYFHPKSIKLNYEQLGIKQGNNYKLYKIVDRATKQKVCVGTISSDEFASMVLSQ